MNIYFFVFIIVIPIAIFLFVIFTDTQFIKYKKLNSILNKNKNKNNNSNNNNNTTNPIYLLNNGIGFGYGKEFFKNSSCNQSYDIGIVFHKFKFGNNFNVKEIDKLILKDYCTEKYLKNNFVNTLNNLWSEAPYKFFFDSIEQENELENLKYNYVDKLSTLYKYPECDDNPGTTSVITTPSNTKPLTDSTDKDTICRLDIQLLILLLAKRSKTQEEKNTIRFLFNRIINKDLLNTNNILHIYLVPFIFEESAILIEGPNEKPLFVVSLFWKDTDCNLVKKTIENVTTPQTCDRWLKKFVTKYNLLNRAEISREKYKSQDTEEIQKLYDNELKVIKEKQSILEDQQFVRLSEEKNDLEKKIEKNKNKDVRKDISIRNLRKYANKKVTVKKPESKNEKPEIPSFKTENTEIIMYNTLINRQLKYLQHKLETELKDLMKKLDNKDNELNSYKTRINKINKEINDIQKDIKKEMKRLQEQKEQALINYENIKRYKKDTSIPLSIYYKMYKLIDINRLLIAMLTDQLPENAKEMFTITNNNKKITDIGLIIEDKEVNEDNKYYNYGILINLNKNSDLVNNLKNINLKKSNLNRLSKNLKDIDAHTIKIIYNTGDEFDSNSKCVVLKTLTENQTSIMISENKYISRDKALEICKDTIEYQIDNPEGLDLKSQVYLLNKHFKEIKNDNSITLQEKKRVYNQLIQLKSKCLNGNYNPFSVIGDKVRQDYIDYTIYSEDEIEKNYEMINIPKDTISSILNGYNGIQIKTLLQDTDITYQALDPCDKESDTNISTNKKKKKKELELNNYILNNSCSNQTPFSNKSFNKEYLDSIEDSFI